MLISADNSVFIRDMINIQQFPVREDVTLAISVYFFKEFISTTKLLIPSVFS
ncbi:hypothetical protein SAMN05443574_13014 [Haloarcula vallismortis]|uniref:Uncharacterized protein n=1 Tax=Haloarcula vallismortis TaxID=28442 RepID=A0A1H3AT55_HALVA|nr:hypothetical protein SAMN05443574_13014 [Haloarcula vallismortis]